MATAHELDVLARIYGKPACIRTLMDGKDLSRQRLYRAHVAYAKIRVHLSTVWEARPQARASVRQWMEFYNQRCLHKALGGQQLAVVYFKQIEATQLDQKE